MSKPKTKPKLQFYQKLILNRFVLDKFGVNDLIELSAPLKNPALEYVTAEGHSGFFVEIVNQFGAKMALTPEQLAQYDLNILSHVRTINAKRANPIVLKYFQYLTLLFVEFYLDNFFNNNNLLDELNIFVCNFNIDFPDDAITEYTKEDLNKIAIWNATGSGKTLVMHINILQFKHYDKQNIKKDGTSLLLTPKEGLSLQHIQDFTQSGISASLYDKNASRMFSNNDHISILENTKLSDKDGDTTVATSRFGNKNLVLVDESHRGSSGDKWYTFRNQLCECGFSFEYSATFGQAMSASNKSELLMEYSKCILFDYSYKYFHSDGYGKDFNILNLADDSNTDTRKAYLTGCLLAYYQQKKLYTTDKSHFVPFNIENPLFVFVGASVNAVRTENKREVSDVVDIVLFLQDFVTQNELYISYIDRILSGTAGLLDEKGQNVFNATFTYLRTPHITAQTMYTEMLLLLFNSSTQGAILHIENVKGIDGEITLRLGENASFGLINVGDDNKLLKLFESNKFTCGSNDFGKSYFQDLNNRSSTINMLIGSKKFTEGWNCWRVSTMGLMNVGKSEGSEIIQLFGRGVRLKGYQLSLKRTSALKIESPKPAHIQILETLHVFGLRANYMQQFRNFLINEGVSSDTEVSVVLKLPVLRNTNYQKAKLLTLRVPATLNFKKDAPKPFLQYNEKITIVLDCYAKVQFESSTHDTNFIADKNTEVLQKKHLSFIDFDAVYRDLLNYKNQTNRYNINIRKTDIIDLMNNPLWYNLYIPKQALEIYTFFDFERFQKIVLTLLIKYFDKLYYMQKQSWETPLLQLEPVTNEYENFLENDEYTITVTNKNMTLQTQAQQFVQKLTQEVDTARKNGTIPKHIKQYFDIQPISTQENMYNPLLFVNKNFEIAIFPVPLNKSEQQFITQLHDFVEANTYFTNKELFIIRNKSKKGIGFFENAGFFPDFIMWLIADGKQYITFIDPHGMRNERFEDSKVKLHKEIKGIENQLQNKNVILNSFILSPTNHHDLIQNSIPIATWNKHNVFFMDNPPEQKNDYVQIIFDKLV